MSGAVQLSHKTTEAGNAWDSLVGRCFGQVGGEVRFRHSFTPIAIYGFTDMRLR